jgi:putative two-component system hydrogenase maturation factor HypX/HoxX
MRLLLLCHSFNSLAQRIFVELCERGHEVAVEFDIADSVTEEAVRLFRPDALIAPFLKRAIPESVWRALPCLIVHPGPEGDRGPSSLDWAILKDEREWGVTVLEANGEFDAGDVWHSENFRLRPTSKGGLYRLEVAEAAVIGVLKAVEALAAGERPRPQAYSAPHAAIKQADRAIDWENDEMAVVLRKIRSADGMPGLRDEIMGRPFRLFDAAPEGELTGPPGKIIARSNEGAICRAVVDGAVWIGHLKEEGAHSLKLPALKLLGQEGYFLPERAGPRDAWYSETGEIGWIHFPFYNGAMSVERCQRLIETIRAARQRPVRILILAGGPDFWSNGIDLAAIEAAASPAEASWENINAIDDVAREILTLTDKLTVAALQGNAGAGGVFLALAADLVFARSGVVLNPHYKGMGNLYGSEYWTYTLPRRTGEANAKTIVEARLPMGMAEAKRLGLVDDAFGLSIGDFLSEMLKRLRGLDVGPMLAAKRAKREADEAIKPLENYRAEELERMKLNFYGFDPSYHVARYNFIFKIPKSRTPLYLAKHRVDRKGSPL